MGLSETDLGEAGEKYLFAELSGERGLSSKVLPDVQQGGRVFAPLPMATPRERALQFDAGGLMTWGGTCAWLAQHMEELSASFPNGSLVFQDVWMQDRDIRGEDRSRALFDSSSVYYVLGPGENNPAAISFAERELKSFKLVAVFCDFSLRAADVSPTRVIDDALIDKMASAAQEVYVSAYDLEGLVVWQRRH